MDPASVYSIFGLALVGHAALVFFECFMAQQFRHLNGIAIRPLPEEIEVDGLMGIELCKEIQCKQVFAGVLLWMKILRVLGIIPIVLYLLATFLAFARPILEDEIQGAVGHALVYLLAAGLLLQVLYIILKLKSRVPSILCSLHDHYRGVPPARVLLDIFPTWGGRT